MNYQEKTKHYISDPNIFMELKQYVTLIEEWNKKMNLTGFTGNELWKQGIFESLISFSAADIPNINEMLDIGAGAGFPSVPFAIVNKKINLTIYEPQKKRIIFLEEVIKVLGLKNITLLNKRIEEETVDSQFDFITARAVASLDVLMEISHKVAKINSVFWFIKGPRVTEEIKEAMWISIKLNIEDINVIEVDNEFDRKIYIVTYVKKHDTPDGFPREWSVIKKESNNVKKKKK